ncbi:hypothetical protein ACFL6T_00095 [Candidatus Zixiibacteriota bacterium]
MDNIALTDSMRRHYCCISLTLMLLLLIPAAASASVVTKDSRQETWRVSYVIRPLLEEGVVEVTAVLMGDVEGSIVWRHADFSERRASQSRPEAVDGFGQTLRVTTHPRGWTITGGTGGGMRLTWQVLAAGPDPIGADGVGIGSEALYAPGYELFLYPDPILSDAPVEVEGSVQSPPDIQIDVIFDIPISWRIIVPWRGYGRSYNPEDRNRLWNAVVAAGDFRRFTVRAAGIDVIIGVQGRRPSLDSSLTEIVERILLFGQQTFEVATGSRMTIVLPRITRGGKDVIRLGSSVSFGWDSTVNIPADPTAVHQLARELLLLWQGTPLFAPDWYTEGATDYLAWLMLLRENLIQRQTFRQQLLLTEQRYRSHPKAGEWSFAEEEARYTARQLTRRNAGAGSDSLADLPPSTSDRESLARSKGALAALVLDATIANLTDGQQRITDVMGLYYRWKASSGSGTAMRDSDLMAVCATIANGNFLDNFFSLQISSTDPPPTATALNYILGWEGGG